MNVRLSIILSLCVAPFAIVPSATGQSTGAEKSTSGPKIYVAERTFDLGRLKQGESGTATFTLENRGTENVIIETVRASCGCTVPTKLTESQKILEPGERLDIEAVFNSKGRNGNQKKTVTITSNDPLEPRLKLFLTANVVTLFEMTVKGRPNARALRFGSVRPGETIKDGIDLLPTEPGTILEITDVTLLTPSLTYTTEPLAKDDRNGYRIKLQVEDDAPIGAIHSSVKMQLKVGQDTAKATLSLTGDVIGELKFRPAELKQLQANLPGKQLAPVSVSSHSRTPFEILRTDVGPNLIAKVEARHGKYDYTVTLRITEDAEPGPFGTFLDIHTSSVEQPLIRIPVFANVAARVSAEPPAILLRQDGTKKSSSRRVKIHAFRRSQKLDLADISTDLPYITVERIDAPGTSGRPSAQYLMVTANGDAPLGQHEGTIRIETSVEGQSVIEIPVTLIVSDSGA